MDQPYSYWTPGHVVPSFSKAPLADEGEATIGDDDLNPAVDPDAREEIERIKRKQRAYAQRDDKLVRTVPQIGFDPDPTDEPNPFVFDDIGRTVDQEIDDVFSRDLFQW